MKVEWNEKNEITVFSESGQAVRITEKLDLEAGNNEMILETKRLTFIDAVNERLANIQKMTGGEVEPITSLSNTDFKCEDCNNGDLPCTKGCHD